MRASSGLKYPTTARFPTRALARVLGRVGTVGSDIVGLSAFGGCRSALMASFKPDRRPLMLSPLPSCERAAVLACPPAHISNAKVRRPPRPPFLVARPLGPLSPPRSHGGRWPARKGGLVRLSCRSRLRARRFQRRGAERTPAQH